jgi:hypothetical protein
MLRPIGFDLPFALTFLTRMQPFPPANAIFAGIGILLSVCTILSDSLARPLRNHCAQAIKDVSASYDALVDLFESTENFLRRLDIYAKIPPATAMTEIVVKILVELLSTLALATQQVKQGRLSMSYSSFMHHPLFNVTREIRKETSWRERD